MAKALVDAELYITVLLGQAFSQTVAIVWEGVFAADIDTGVRVLPKNFLWCFYRR